MPFWDEDALDPDPGPLLRRRPSRGSSAASRPSRRLSFEELDNLDHLSLREWMSQYTSDEGVYEVWEAISVLEQITLEPWEHSASENLFIRKLHYERKRTAGYSFWPMGGWDALWTGWPTRSARRGGEVNTRGDGRGGRRARRRRQGRAAEGRRGARGRRGRRSTRPSGTSTSCSPTARCRGTSAPRQGARRQPEPGLLVRLLDRRRGAGDRVLDAGDGLVLHHAARRPARLHAVLHRL